MSKLGAAMKKSLKHDRFVPPIMQAFRAAFKERDAQKDVQTKTEAGDRIISGRRATPRNIVNEALLREQLAEDLATLLNTVNLASAENLEDLEEIQCSVLNFGIDDLTSISADSADAQKLGPRLRQILQHHEDRFVKDSVKLSVEPVTIESSARIAIHINAEMFASPADLPVEFLADVEPYSGKVRLKTA